MARVVVTGAVSSLAALIFPIQALGQPDEAARRVAVARVAEDALPPVESPGVVEEALPGGESPGAAEDPAALDGSDGQHTPAPVDLDRDLPADLDHDLPVDAGHDPPAAGNPCPEAGETEPALERFRRGMERGVCWSAWRFDSMFGVLPEDEVIEDRVTHGRLRTGLEWDERDGFGQDVSLRAQVQMPLARQRLSAVFGRDTDEAFIEGGSREFDGTPFATEDEDRSWLLGLGYRPIDGTRARLTLGAGVRLRTPPDPYLQASYWFNSRLREDLMMRARQTVFWENEDGFGTTSRLAFERALDGERMLRWSNNARLSEGTDGIRWNTSLTLYQALSDSRAIALRGAVRGETGREVNPIEYKLLLIHRRRFMREWLFLEVRGGGGWLRTEQAEPRDFAPEAAVVLEMSFGRRSRTPESTATGDAAD